MAKKGGKKKKAKLKKTLKKSPSAARQKLAAALNAAAEEFTRVSGKGKKKNKKGQSQPTADLLVEVLPLVAARMLASKN